MEVKEEYVSNESKRDDSIKEDKYAEKKVVVKALKALPTVTRSEKVLRADAAAENLQPAITSLEQKVSVGANSDKLPIDAHRDTILNKIRNERVVIIHGETGVYMCT